MSGQVVQITINVTDGNAAEAVQQVVAQLNAIGPAGEAAGAKAGAGLDQVDKHALSARENVRLLNEDLGLRVPRAMQSVIANSQLMSSALSMIGPGLIAMGAVDIFAHMAESAYNLYEKYVSINAAQDEFLKKLQESRDKDFVNVHSIETARLRIDDATSAMNGFRGAAEALSKDGWGDILSGNFGVGVGELLSANNMSEASAEASGQAQELSPAEQNLLHQQRMASLEAEHAGDSELKGQSKITAELQKQLDLNKEKQRYSAIEDRERGNPGGSNSGRTLQAKEDQAARAKAHAEEIALQRQETDQIVQMHNEAVNAGLEGNALRDAQEAQGIDAIVRKFMTGEIDKQAGIAETYALQEKFAAQALKLQEQLDEQTKHMADEAAQAGLKGVPLINAQLWSQLDAIDAVEKKAVGPGGSETSAQSEAFASQRQSAWSISGQKITESQTQFNERIRALTDSADDYQLQGYSRIEAATSKHLDSLQKDYEEHYGKDRSLWTGYQAAKTQIEADSDRDMVELHQKTTEQITKEEQQAARMSLPEWQQAQMAIVDAYNDRVKEIGDAEQRELATFKGTDDQKLRIEQEFNQQRTAANDLANAQMQRANEETRDKLASGLQEMFRDPAKFFEDRAMQLGTQMLATDLMPLLKGGSTGGNMLQWFFGMGPQMSMSTNPADQLSSVFSGTHGATSGTGLVLSNAGTTLLSAGNVQLTAAQALLTGATALQSAAGSMGFGGGTAGMGSMGGLPGFGGTGSGDSSGAGLPFISGGTGGADWGVGNQGFGPAMVAGGAAGDYSTSLTDGGAMSSGALASQTSGLAPGLGGAGKYAGIAGGAITAGMGIYSAFENSNPVAGALSGAMGGAAIGGGIGALIAGSTAGSVAGPVGMVIGAAIGGVAGLLAGLFGDQGKGKAVDLDKNTVQPELSQWMQEYETGRSGYNALSQQLNSLEISAKNSTTQWGSGARRYFNDTIAPEINTALVGLQQQEMRGRGAVTFSGAQYHSGGWVGDFGDLSTGANEGFAKLLADEFVVQPMAARSHAPLLNAINSGSVSYASSVQPRMPASSGGTTIQLTVQALDSKSVAQWAKAGGGRTLVAAINQAQRQYSGVGRG